MTLAERLKIWIETNNLTPRQVERESGLSMGYIAKVKRMGAGKLKQIQDAYPTTYDKEFIENGNDTQGKYGVLRYEIGQVQGSVENEIKTKVTREKEIKMEAENLMLKNYNNYLQELVDKLIKMCGEKPELSDLDKTLD